jgi:energy-coupling factor transport system ATP-binding protein
MIHLENLTYTYPEAETSALRDISLHIPAGEMALVTGPSGAGKSTLLRCLNGLVPHFSGGALTGRVTVAGRDPVRVTPQVMSRYVGFVFQDPEAQFVMDRVEDEAAFALENAALPHAEMHERVASVLALLELTPLRHRRVTTLSGGEKQRVAMAAALVLRPKILVLDEPTSQLDPSAADEVLRALRCLNAELGMTVVLSEHRVARVAPFVDRIIHLPARGAPVMVGPPREVLRHVAAAPPVTALGKALGWSPLPLSVAEARGNVGRNGIPTGRITNPPHADVSEASAPVIEARGLEVSYGRQPVLRGVDLTLRAGEIGALVGPNGAGKTTLLKCLVGLLRPQRGGVSVAGASIAGREVADICREVGYLPQDPNALLFAETVIEELRITLRNHGLLRPPSKCCGRRLAEPPRARRGRRPEQHGTFFKETVACALLDRLGLTEHAQSYPRDLSVGERQRVALGAMMVTGPKALLLDEPTRGLDLGAKERLAALLRDFRAEGMAILLVTHDVELVAAVADRVWRLQAGEIVARGRPAEVLAGDRFAPQMARLFPGAGWLTVTDVLRGLAAD